MGTAVSIDVRDPLPESALPEALAVLHAADRAFSPYRPDSAVSALQRGESPAAEYADDLAEVLELCAALEAETGGWFRATIDGRFDPSGAVKGWALARSAAALGRAGARRMCVNGGGDVVVGARPEPGRRWGVGVADPLVPGRLAAVLRLEDCAIATSGTAERGGHVLDPHTGEPATQLASATVVGPDLVRADAWATAAVAMGWDAPERLDTLQGHAALVVGRDGRRWQSRNWAELLTAGL